MLKSAIKAFKLYTEAASVAKDPRLSDHLWEAVDTDTKDVKTHILHSEQNYSPLTKLEVSQL